MNRETIPARQARLVKRFHALDGWKERYRFILDQGRDLPLLPPYWRTAAHRIPSCASRAWVRGSGDAECLGFLGASDCPLDAGLMAIAVHLFSGQPAAAIIATPPSFIGELGLPGRMAAQRIHGFHAMVHQMRHIAIRRLLHERGPAGQRAAIAVRLGTAAEPRPGTGITCVMPLQASAPGVKV